MGNNLSIGERLAEERHHLRMTQSEFAEVADVTRKTLYGYESGARFPDASALALWALLGADVNYILTGQRTGNAPAPHALTPEQRALLDNYAACDPGTQKTARNLVATAAKLRQVTGGKNRNAGKQ